MIITNTSDVDGDPSWDEETKKRIVKLLPSLTVCDCQGTLIPRVIAIDTVKNAVTFYPKYATGTSFFFDEDNAIVAATMIIKGLQMWVYPDPSPGVRGYRVDENFNIIEPVNA